MKSRISLLVVFAIVCALGLAPGVSYAAVDSAGGGLQAGATSSGQRAEAISRQLATQSEIYVDGGTFGSCEWEVDDDNGEYYLYITPSNGSYGWLESTYIDEDTDGSTAPWYEYSDKIHGIIVFGHVCASESCDAMFCDCPNLMWADLAGLDTSGVTDMEYMFYGCSSLETIWVTSLWSTENVEYSAHMFTGCISLEGGNGTPFYSDSDDALYANVDYADNPGYLTSRYLGDADVRLTVSSYTYDGQAKRPMVMVSIGNDTLDSDDYVVTYSDNVNAGKATVTVMADEYGVYEGEATATFTINPASIASGNLSLSKASSPYTGKTQNGVAKSLVVGGRTLKPGVDYTVSAKSGKNVGSYAVTATGKGNYAGTKSAAFKITVAKNTAKAKKTAVKKTFKSAKVKKKAQAIALPKVTAKFGKAKWSVAKKDKKKVLTLSGNKVKVKKGARAGTYTIKLRAKVAKTKNYKAATTKVVTVKVVVK